MSAASAAAAFAYGTPVTDASLDAFSTSEIAQWSLSVKKGENVKNIESLYTNEKLLLDVQLLCQSIDVDSIRASVAEPFSVYSPNRYSIKWAIKSVADAAATLYVSDLLKKYNSRARDLFTKSVKSQIKQNSDLFKSLFDEVISLNRPGGWVLLKPHITKPLDVEVEGTTFPSQSKAKRVKLIARENSDMVSYAMVAPRTSADVRRELESEMFPAIDMAPKTDYEIIAGSTVTVGNSDNQNIAKLLSRIITLNDAHTAFSTGQGVEANESTRINAEEQNYIPQLFPADDAEAIRQRFMFPIESSLDSPFMYMDYADIIEEIRRVCEREKKRYIEETQRYITQLEDSLGNIINLDGDLYREIAYVKAFLQWTLESTDNYVVCGYREDTAKTFNQCSNAELGVNNAGGDQASQNINNSLKQPFDPTKTTPIRFVMRDVWRKRNETRRVGEFQNLYADVGVSQSVKRDPLTERFVFVKDLRRFTKTQSFAQEIPTKGRGEALTRLPTVITPAYRPLVLHGENELRFKLSLIPNLGINPMFWSSGGKDDDDQVGAFAVATDDQRQEFDADMKAFEFDLQIRDMKGYNDEYRVAMRMVLQVLFSKVKCPLPDKVTRLGSVYLKGPRTISPLGSGFVFTPHVPQDVANVSGFDDKFRVPVLASSQQSFIDSYPRWTDGGSDVSAAALYLWRHAVATSTQPFSIEGSGSSLNDLASMMAMSEPFAPMDKDSQDLCTVMLRSLIASPPFQNGEEDSLHLIQLTSSEAAPGGSGYSQPFPPLRVHFKGAAIMKHSDNPKSYKLRYSLGSESTVLIESVFIATALLKVLQLNGRFASSEIETKDLPRKVPHSNSRPAIFPRNQEDAEYKRDVTLYSDAVDRMSLSYALSYKLPEYPAAQFSLGAYGDFLGLPPNAMNKAGRVVFCAKSGPQYQELKDKGLPPGYYALVDGPQPFQGIRKDLSMSYESRIDISKVLQDDDKIRASLVTFADYWIYAIVCDAWKNSRRVKIEKDVSLPVYMDFGKGRKLVAYINLIFDIESIIFISGDNPVKVTWVRNLSRVKVSGIHVFDSNAMKWSQDGSCNFCSNVDVGLQMSPDFKRQVGIPDDGNDFVTFARFDTEARFTFSQDTIQNNIKAYEQFGKMESGVRYETSRKQNVGAHEIKKLLKDGFQGFHFGRTDSLSKTIFAVALNDMQKEIKDHYEKNDETFVVDDGRFAEPRAIHLVHPGKENKHDAALLSHIMKSESERGVKNYGRAATTSLFMVSPLIVEVMGPAPNALSTACYVDNVVVKTAMFRSIEQQILAMLQSHLDMVRSPSAVKARVTFCLAERLFKERSRGLKSIRQILSYRPGVTQMMATLMVKIKNYNKISAKTDAGRNPTSIGIAYKDIEACVHNILFKI